MYLRYTKGNSLILLLKKCEKHDFNISIFKINEKMNTARKKILKSKNLVYKVYKKLQSLPLSGKRAKNVYLTKVNSRISLFIVLKDQFTSKKEEKRPKLLFQRKQVKY